MACGRGAPTVMRYYHEPMTGEESAARQDGPSQGVFDVSEAWGWPRALAVGVRPRMPGSADTGDVRADRYLMSSPARMQELTQRRTLPHLCVSWSRAERSDLNRLRASIV